MVRNESIDSIKGILIVLVIIGHILLGTLDENFLRYVIYSFHMPVFLFISGYLINMQKIQNLTIKGLMEKYWQRMLLPWVIALILYSLALSVPHFTILEFVNKLAHPYYHLWYVPTLFVFISIVWIMSHIKEKTTAMIFALVLGLIFHSFLHEEGCFRMNFFIFFIIGVFAKNAILKVENSWTDLMGGGILIIFIVGVTLLFVQGISMKSYTEKLRIPSMLMVCLLSVLPVMVKNKLKSTLLCYLGSHSLEFYLWHVFPIMVLKYFFKNSETQYLYYSLAFGMMLITLITIQVKSKLFPAKQQ